MNKIENQNKLVKETIFSLPDVINTHNHQTLGYFSVVQKDKVTEYFTNHDNTQITKTVVHGR